MLLANTVWIHFFGAIYAIILNVAFLCVKGICFFLACLPEQTASPIFTDA